MANLESDLGRRVQEFQLGKTQRRSSGELVAFDQEESLTSFLKSSLILIPEFEEVKNALASTDKKLKSFVESTDTLSMEMSVKAIIGEDEVRRLMPQWNNTFTTIFLHGRTLEEFMDVDDDGGELLKDMSRIYDEGQNWFGTRLPSKVELNSAK